MIKNKFLQDIIIIFIGIFLPYYFLNESTQILMLIIILISSILLTYLNINNIRNIPNNKIWWIFFETIGILGIIFSGIILYLIFSFRHGIGL